MTLSKKIAEWVHVRPAPTEKRPYYLLALIVTLLCFNLPPFTSWAGMLTWGLLLVATFVTLTLARDYRYSPAENKPLA